MFDLFLYPLLRVSEYSWTKWIYFFFSFLSGLCTFFWGVFGVGGVALAFGFQILPMLGYGKSVGCLSYLANLTIMGGYLNNLSKFCNFCTHIIPCLLTKQNALVDHHSF